MTRLLIAIVLLSLSACQECYAGYTLVVRDRVTPEKIEVYRPEGKAWVDNPGPPPSYPATVQRLVYTPPGFDVHSDDPALRTELWSDSYGIASSSAIFSAFPKIRDWRAATIRAEGARRLEALTPYLPAERDTWPIQQSEAKEWRADNTCSCPMIRKIAEKRGIALQDLVAKIEENVALFPAASGEILGEQQRLLDLIYSETDFDTFMSINWQ